MSNIPGRPEDLIRAERQDLDLGNCVSCNKTLFQVCPSCEAVNEVIFNCPMRLDADNRLWHDHCLERENRCRCM